MADHTPTCAIMFHPDSADHGPCNCHRITATIVAGEFVPEGDPYRDDKDDEPRPAGTYLTVHFDNADTIIFTGKVTLEYLPKK